MVKTIENKTGIGTVETQYFTFANPPGELLLESGERLGPITLAYETYGALNADKSNLSRRMTAIAAHRQFVKCRAVE